MINEFMQGETIIAQERQTVDVIGNPIWVTTTKVPMRNEMGQVVGIVGISRDVTHAKRAEEALLESEGKFRQIVETATEGIWIIDVDCQTKFVNPRMADMLGYSVDEIVGKSLFEFMDVVEGHSPPIFGMGVQGDNPAEERDFKFRTKDGRALWAILSTTLMTDPTGEISGALVMLTDITGRKQAESQALELAATRQRVQVLKRFITDMSHDFRTPITIIQTSLFILRRTATEKQEARIDVLEAQTARLTMLLDELNEVYALEGDNSGWLDFSNVNDALTRIIASTAVQAEKKQLRVEFLPDESLPPILLDLPRFERAIAQIVTNAIYYTPANGLVTISSAVKQGQLMITVKDTGIGIKPKDLPHIFEHFYRADQARSTETGGNGLGLTIAQKIIEAQGGTITVESVPGQGSTFQVFLPSAEAAPADETISLDTKL